MTSPLVVEGILDGRRVSVNAQSGNHGNRLVQEITVVSERLALVHVGDVHLDERDCRGQQRISDSHRGVRVGAGVDDNEANALFFGLVDPVNDEALGVVLVREQLGPIVLGNLGAGLLLEVGESGGAVFFRLPGAEEIKVRAVDEKHFLHHAGILHTFQDRKTSGCRWTEHGD